MNSENFYHITSVNNKKRIALQSVVAILLMYAMILVCLWLHFEWWAKYDWACIMVSFVYLTFLASIEYETNVSIFRDRFQRLSDFADYNEAPYFANRLRNYYAPVRNGDYIVLSNDKYLKFDCYSSFIGKDIDFNCLYSMEVSLMDRNKKIYETKREDYDYSGLLEELYRKIKDDSLDIEAIYNKFGDLKWRRSEQFRKKSKARQYRLKINHVIWAILKITIAVLPVLFILFS